MTEAALGLYLGHGGLQEITLVLPNTLTVASGVFKMVFFYRDRGRYYGLVRRTDRLTVLQLAAPGEDAAAIVRDAGRHSLKLSSSVYAFVSLQIIVWFPMPLIAYPGQRKLPFVQLPWNNNTEIPVYELSYALQCFSSFTIIFITLGMDCLFAVIMIHVAAQFEILITRIRNLRLDLSTSVMQQKPMLSQRSRNSGTSMNTPTESKEILEFQHQITEAHDKMYSDLCNCVEVHQEIIRFVRHLETMMSPIAMTQFVFSVLVACVALYQATYSEDFSAVFRCAGFLPVPGGQVYLYCWAAHLIMEQSEAVSAAAYACSWIEASPRFKRTLRILMCRAQKPLVLTAGRLYQVHRSTFLSLVNASYSYYALLGQISKR
ncbi:odorant receptor Or2-like [Schistocerca gregaria]|uniref:odorant receptor Or2-like n=1 Tax=Schistocerca gregaria TaxID=7010 RepID=UPI00211E373A|nr:odorant receptor Or2-like [Schistocerca gregaria]